MFLTDFSDNEQQLEESNSYPDAFWNQVMAVKTAVNKELEVKRSEKIVGSGLSAEVDLYCDSELKQLLDSLGEELRFVLIVSRANVHDAANAPADAVETEVPGLLASVSPSSFTKCERCWHHREDVGSTENHPSLCSRCVTNIDGEGEQRAIA